jgi:RNA recognition motif-containing protein
LLEDRARSYSRSRSRSPIVKTEARSPNRRTERNSKSSAALDRELGLKYKWEKTVYVSNIAFGVKWTELKDLFRDKVGDVQYCEIFERNGKSYGCGAVEFKHSSDAEKAVELLNLYEIEARKINVRLDPDGASTRRTKEICKKTEIKGAKPIGRTNSTSVGLMSLNQANTFTMGLSQTSSTNGLTSLLGLVNPLLSNPLGQTNMLNQLAQQLNIEGPVTTNVFVANLDFKVTESKLREVFNLAGNVMNASFFRDRDGRNRGIALVEYATGFEALNAITMFDNQELLDRRMSVRFDTKPKENDLPSLYLDFRFCQRSQFLKNSFHLISTLVSYTLTTSFYEFCFRI